ncbi:MAG: hypothetical protein ACI4A3_11890 [Lachnospiraceae bacterium]
MVMEIAALAVNVGVSFIIPLIIAGILLAKNPMERKRIFLLFVSGVLIYFIMQWGIKEHGLAFLFNHTELTAFMEQHYIPYLLLVALAGAVLAILPELVIIVVLLKWQISFKKAVAFGLGYTAMESVMLVGYKSAFTIFEICRDSSAELSTSAAELFLSGYERVLMSIIQIALVVAFIYFAEQKMVVRGCIIKVFCHTLAAFLPAFFIAFSLTNYYEVYDRSVALLLVYIVLTAAAFCSLVVLNSLKYQLRDETVDSPKAVAAYREKQEEKKKKKEKKTKEKELKKQKK